MDADVAITIAFCLEAFLVAVVGGIVGVHEARKTRSHRVAPGGRGR